MKSCKQCRSPVADNQSFCSNCGADLRASDALIDLDSYEVTSPESSLSSTTISDKPVASTKKNNHVGVIIVIAILAIAIAAAVVLLSNNDKIETNGYALWEAGEGTKMEYEASGTYYNALEGESHSISGGYKLWVTKATDTTITTDCDGKITIKGLGSSPVYFGGTVKRTDIKNDTSSYTTTISTKAGDVKCYVITEKTSTAVYDSVKITTYRGVSDGIMYKRTYEQSAHSYGSTTMTCNLTYTLKSLYIDGY